MFLITILFSVIIIGVVYFVSRDFLSDQLDQVTGRITPPRATGNVGDLEDALLKELSDMETLFTEEVIELDAMMSDKVEINNFGQSIKEDEL